MLTTFHGPGFPPRSVWAVVQGSHVELLVAEGDPLRLRIEPEDDHLDLVTHLHELRRMLKPAEGHLPNVEQAANATDVHKRSVLGEIAHFAPEHPPDFERREGLRLFLFETTRRESTMLPRRLFSLMTRSSSSRPL